MRRGTGSVGAIDVIRALAVAQTAHSKFAGDVSVSGCVCRTGATVITTVISRIRPILAEAKPLITNPLSTSAAVLFRCLLARSRLRHSLPTLLRYTASHASAAGVA